MQKLAEKCTHGTVKTFAAAIENGYSNRAACAFSKISEPTYYAWKKAYKDGVKNNINAEILEEFFTAIEEARAKFEMRCLDKIKDAADTGPQHWTASAWMLERKFPEDYSITHRSGKVEISAGSSDEMLRQAIKLYADGEMTLDDLTKLTRVITFKHEKDEVMPAIDEVKSLRDLVKDLVAKK